MSLFDGIQIHFKWSILIKTYFKLYANCRQILNNCFLNITKYTSQMSHVNFDKKIAFFVLLCIETSE
jgi:hypothetical protein